MKLTCRQELVEHVRATMPMLPTEQYKTLMADHGISLKDAKTLVSLDDGQRLEYFEEVLNLLAKNGRDKRRAGMLASNWILHEVGGHLSMTATPFETNPISASTLASLLQELEVGTITGHSAKSILGMVFEGDDRGIPEIIKQDRFAVQQLDEESYHRLAQAVVERFPDMADKVRKGQKGKLQWFVGQLMRQREGKIDAQKAAAALKPLLSE